MLNQRIPLNKLLKCSYIHSDQLPQLCDAQVDLNRIQCTYVCFSVIVSQCMDVTDGTRHMRVHLSVSWCTVASLLIYGSVAKLPLASLVRVRKEGTG